MPDIATPQYARALLAEQARKMRETITEVMRTECDQIMAHKLAEVAAECEWYERQYGIHDWNESQQHKEGNRND